MDPRAFLVASDLDVVIWVQYFRGSVAKRGERGDMCVFFLVVFVVVTAVTAADFPYTDFVVLVCAEEFVGMDDQGLYCAVSREDSV